MTLSEKKSTLIGYLKMKTIQEDWHGVSDAANDLREIEVMINLSGSYKEILEPTPSQAAPPVEVDIPHHANEVLNLLRLNDEDLVDKMFPDYSELQEKGE